MQLGRKYLPMAAELVKVFQAALEANDLLVGFEKAKLQHEADVDRLTAQKESLASVIADEQARINQALAEYAGVAAAEQAKLHAEVQAARLRADDAKAQADLACKACADRIADASAKADAEEKRLSDAQKRLAEIVKRVAG
jgi:hypothetical protein